MSDRSPHIAEGGAPFGAAVRPFRRAVLALSDPLAGVEVALGAAAGLASMLEPPLAQFDASPFGALPTELFGGAPAQPLRGPSTPGLRSTRRRRPAAPTPTPRAAKTGQEIPGGAGRTAAQQVVGAEVKRAADAVAPGTGPAAAATAQAAVAGVELLGQLADTALAAFAPDGHSPARATSRAAATPGGLLGGVMAGVPQQPAPPPGRTTQPGSARRGRAPAPPGANPFSGMPRLIADLQAAAAVDAVVPGAGGAAVAAAHGLAAGATLLGQLADTALAAVAPARPEPPASHVPAAPARPGALDTLLLPSPAPPAAGERGGAPVASNGRPGRPDESHETAAAPPPQELAWLVNEALVEQARRHGVDLS